jgi:glycosyltransferase involved in cell wall biosynthesis
MSRRLHILHLTASLYTGGAERVILGLAPQLNRAEFAAHICAIGEFGQDSLLQEFQRLDLPVQQIPSRRFYDPRILAALVRYIRRQRIDLIHTHLLYADILGRFVGSLLRVPVVTTLHNESPKSQNVRADKRWLNRLTARYGTAHFVAVSNRTRQCYLQEWQLDERRVSTIYNAIQMAPFLAVPEPPATEPEAAGGAPLMVTTIGRLESQKGHHLLLQAAQQVLAHKVNVRVRFVGQGPLEAQLRSQAQELGIADQVEFTGLRRDIPAILAQSDIFVMPSLWEGLSIAAIEAMAAARPLILSDVGGNRELIADGQEGLLIPRNDSDALAQALLTLLRSPELRAALGRQARARARRHFHIDTMTRQYEALYRTLCNGQPAAEQQRAGIVPLGSVHD